MSSRLVENELMQNSALSLVSASLYASWDFEEDIAAGVKHWQNKIVPALSEPNWANGRHEGDCTQIPATCLRCLVEKITDEARKIIIAMDQQEGSKQ